MFKPTLVFTLLGMLAGCAATADLEGTAPRSAEAPVTGKEIHVQLPADMAPEQAHAIAKHLEGQGKVASVKVQIRKDDDGTAALIAELWGSFGDAPISAGLRTAFPALASAEIEEIDLDGDSPELAVGHEVHSDAEDPRQAEREITEQLRAQGVDGDVQVKVSDGPDGRRVEVDVRKVEKH